MSAAANIFCRLFGVSLCVAAIGETKDSHVSACKYIMVGLGFGVKLFLSHREEHANN